MAQIPYDVAEAFMKAKAYRRGNFYSTGSVISSYNLQLAHWTDQGPAWVIHPDQARKYSLTTARHVNALLRVLPYRQ